MRKFSGTSPPSRQRNRVAQLNAAPLAANDNDPANRIDPPGPIGRNYIILLLVFIGVALSYWLTAAFLDWDRVQACVTLGHRNCVPAIDIEQQR